MHRPLSGCLAAFLLAGALLAQPADSTDGKIVRDLWDAAYLDGNRAGYVRTSVRELERDGKKQYWATVVLDLTVRRFKDVSRLQLESGTMETADGKVTAVFMSQSLAKQQKLVLRGVVDGKTLVVKVTGPQTMERKIPWNDSVVGLYREQQIYKQGKAKSGDTFSYQHYEPVVNAVVTVRVTVKDYEEVDLGGVKKKLLRTEAIPDKILGVQLPATTFWLDSDLEVVRSQVQMEGLGKLTVQRTTRETALSPVVPAKISDIGVTQLVSLNRKIAKPHETSSAIYKVSLPADDEPATALPGDGRQEIKNAKGKSFELHVRAIRQPAAKADAPAAADEFLKSNYFINCDDLKVQELARRAAALEKDPWKKALRFEKWVHDNMKIQNFTEAMATADHVARTLEGDCTEHAMLTAAMCRAAGVPARTALGFVYVELPRGPFFGYHMWTEVYVQGQWLGLDATLGRGGIGAAHIKITDHSWHETRSLAPLLPVMRVMLGKVAIEVVRVGGTD